MIDELASASYISVLDMTKGYWQVPMDPSSQEKTAFTTSFGKFHFTVMPFGLAGAPAVFQRLMNRVLEDMVGSAGAYMDDVVIYSKAWPGSRNTEEDEEHRIDAQGI